MFGNNVWGFETMIDLPTAEQYKAIRRDFMKALGVNQPSQFLKYVVEHAKTFEKNLQPGKIDLQFELKKRFLLIICELLFGKSLIEQDAQIEYKDPFTFETSKKNLIDAIVNIPNDQF